VVSRAGEKSGEQVGAEQSKPETPELSPEAEGRAEIVEAAEGEWVERPPPDREPQFRCVVRPRGSVVARSRRSCEADGDVRRIESPPPPE